MDVMDVMDEMDEMDEMDGMDMSGHLKVCSMFEVAADSDRLSWEILV